MIDIVAFKWRTPGYRSSFGPEAVNVLRASVARHYPKPHRFTCITDDARGLDPAIRVVPLWDDHARVPNPSGSHNPSCYRRLKLFAPEAATLIGPCFVCLDLDTVITGDLTPIVEKDVDFCIWGETDFPGQQWYNGSLWRLRAGTRTQVWTAFDPTRSPARAHAAGARGSDQGWISYVLGPRQPTFGKPDGVFSFRKDVQPRGGVLPEGARVVCFHGRIDPWAPEAQRLPWVRQHWSLN